MKQQFSSRPIPQTNGKPLLPSIQTESGSSVQRGVDKWAPADEDFPPKNNHPSTNIEKLLQPLESEQEDDDEGFVPSKIIIKENITPKIDISKSELPPNHSERSFQARYITDGVMRKEPPECYRKFSRYDYCEQPFDIIQSAIDSSEYLGMSKSLQMQKSAEMQASISSSSKKFMTPYDKFVASGHYSLIYSRYREHTFTNDQSDADAENFAKNQVRLDCLLQSSPEVQSGGSVGEIHYKLIKPFEAPQSIAQNISSTKEKVLYFDSKFECGNLLSAYKHKKKSEPYTYSLFIQNDTNTIGYNQWFYFSVRNAEKGIKYCFNIVNFRKRHSFFKEGNRPVVFSLKESKKHRPTVQSGPEMQNSKESGASVHSENQLLTSLQSGYSKRASNVKYERSQIVKSYDSKEKYYKLSFDLEFPNDDDIYYVSMGLPFSYSKLIHNLNLHRNQAIENSKCFQIESIGKSISGNMVPCVTIWQSAESESVNQDLQSHEQRESSDSKEDSEQQDCSTKQLKEKVSELPEPGPIEPHDRPILLFLGRQHPGQTWSSYLMDELFGELTSSSSYAYILQKFVVKAIPMVNVDGVIYGNFRCDLSGMDLNRTWKSPSSILHPQILSVKQAVSSWVHSGREVAAAFDLHGHSKDYNVFCYGAGSGLRQQTASQSMESSLSQMNSEEMQKSGELPSNLQGRLLPFIFSQLNPKFHWPNCSFGISRYKQHTARAVLYSILKRSNVLTIESSFFGSRIPVETDSIANCKEEEQMPRYKRQVFEPIHFQEMSQSILKGIQSFFSRDQSYSLCLENLISRSKQELQHAFQSEKPRDKKWKLSRNQKQSSLQSPSPQSQLKSKGESKRISAQEKASKLKGLTFNHSEAEHHCSSGSDSEPSGDEMAIEEKFERILPKALIKDCIKEVERQKNMKIKKKQSATLSPTKVRIKKAKKTSIGNSKTNPNHNQTIDVIEEEQNPTNLIKKEHTEVREVRPSYKKRYSEPNRTVAERFKRLSEEEGVDQLISAEIDNQRRNHMQLKEKPITQMIPLKLKNESYEIFRDAYNATEKQFSKKLHNSSHTPSQMQREQTNQARRRISSKRVGIYREKSNDKEDEFPMLCVLSENKKKTHADKFYNSRGDSLHGNRHIRGETQQEKNSAMMPTKTLIQTRTEAIKQLRDKNKNSMELVSKIWKDNFTRYGMAFNTFKITK